MGNLGFQEILLIIVMLAALLLLPMYVAYRFGKTRGRLEEMERRMKKKVM